MKKLLRLALLSSIPLFIQGCGSDAVAENQVNEKSLSVIHSGMYLASGQSTSKGSRVFTSKQAYESELLNYSSELPKSIDFTQSRVFLVDMGERNSGGYSIEIDGITEHDGYVLATVVLTEPGDGCMITQAITNPFQFIEVATTKEILIEEKIAQSSCN